MAKNEASGRPFEILGVEGAKISSGFVHDEYLQRLVGERGRRVFREMRDNDSVVSAVLFAIEMLLRAVEWTVAPSTEEDEGAIEGAEFMESVMGDMSHTWDDFIGNVLTMLTFGWQYTEVVYKRRLGPHQKDPSMRSEYTDGMIGIRKLGDRSQETLNRWEIDQEDGSIEGLWQDPPNGGSGVRYIPIERALLFRPHQHKGSPEGRSVLRGAYRSWYLLKNIEEIEAIAIERELNGLPVVYIPNATLNGSSAEAVAALNKYKQLVRDIKLNAQGGVVLPSDPWYDSDGKPSAQRQVELQLLNANGTRAIDTDIVVKRYQANIARTVLADFIMLGQGDRGSFALSRSKVDLFAKALEGWLGSIAEVINRHLIPRLWGLNAFDPATAPTLVPGRVAPEDLRELGDYVEALSRAGVPLVDEDTEARLRSAGGLPGPPVAEELESTIPRDEDLDDEDLDDEPELEKITLEKPFRLPAGSSKKFGVYVRNDKGDVVKVTFGDPDMEIRRDDPEARRSFRARHNCNDPGPKWKARYWSCRQWRADAKVED
jgi:hypothetical protein